MARAKEAYLFIDKKMYEKWLQTNKSTIEPTLTLTLIFLMKRFKLSHRSVISLFNQTFDQSIKLPSESKVFKEIAHLNKTHNYMKSFSYTYLTIDSVEDVPNIKAKRTNNESINADNEVFSLSGRIRNNHIFFDHLAPPNNSFPLLSHATQKNVIKKEVNQLDQSLTCWFEDNHSLIKTFKSVLSITNNEDLFDALIPFLIKKKWKSHGSTNNSWIINRLNTIKSSLLQSIPDKSAYISLALNKRNTIPTQSTFQIGSLTVSLIALAYKENKPTYAGDPFAKRLLLWCRCNNSGMNFTKLLDKWLKTDEQLTYSIEVVKKSNRVTISAIDNKIDIPYVKQGIKRDQVKTKNNNFGYASSTTLNNFGHDIPNNFQTNPAKTALKATPLEIASYEKLDEDKLKEHLTLWVYYLNSLSDLSADDKIHFDKSEYIINIQN
jgi:hypothetical protein